jgi:bacillithiol biosynthesis cysteine-adding enzyme BshC
MPLSKSSISFEGSKQFSNLFLDYVNGKLKEFYTYEPSIEGIKKFTEENQYSTLDRALLVNELIRQNKNITLSQLSRQNIEKLKDKKTFTVTTGHQLCLATGPLYFIYKIISAINLCEELNKNIPRHYFVPVYWLASEDHDVEEINHINLFNKKITWNTEQKGRVGDFNLNDISSFLSELKQILGENENASAIFSVLEKAYTQSTLADATRYLVNELFGDYGLLILDGNSKALKQQFIPEIRKDIFENSFFKKVSDTIAELQQKGYDAQVTPREINIFYAGKNIRERIVQEGTQYKVLNTSLSFTKEEIERLLENEPEKFSPNVVTRPLYQQKILPNAVYMGGPGELAYWLEYKKMFSEAAIPLPVLVPRNFILYIDKNTNDKIHKLGLKTDDFFEEKDKLVKKIVLSQNPFSLANEKSELEELYTRIKESVTQVDKTLSASADAELQKNLKSLETLEQKAIRAIKQKSDQLVNQAETIYTRLFPDGKPQERVENFLRFYTGNPHFISSIKQNSGTYLDGKYVTILSEE